MSYTWTNGELITAEKLNNTGGCGVLIIGVHEGETETEVVLESTWQEIYDAFTSGVVCLLDLSYEGKTNLYALTSVTSEPNGYNVFFDGNGSNLGYTANSANGYPSQSFD